MSGDGARWDRMTEDEKTAYVARRVAETRAAQGLPPKIEDPEAYRILAAVLRSGRERAELMNREAS